MRHLLIGNSHLAALKLGWDQIKKKHKGTELMFAGARGQQFRRLHLDGNVLTSSSPQGRNMIERLAGTSDPIDVSTFDRVWIVGAQYAVLPYIRLYLNYRSEDHPSLGTKAQILSAPTFALAASSVFDDSSGNGLAQELVALGSAVGIITQPMPSHAALSAGRWAALDPDTDLAPIADMFNRGLNDVADRLEVTVHTQPTETLQTPITTRSEFARGSAGLRDNRHDDDDVIHMNGDYGCAIVETHILSS